MRLFSDDVGQWLGKSAHPRLLPSTKLKQLA